VEGRPSRTNRPVDPSELSQYFRMPTVILRPQQKPGFPRGFVNSLKPKGQKRYFFTASPGVPYLRTEALHAARAITHFCLPVKNGGTPHKSLHEISLFLRRPFTKLVAAEPMHAPFAVHRIESPLY